MDSGFGLFDDKSLAKFQAGRRGLMGALFGGKPLAFSFGRLRWHGFSPAKRGSE
jgi:hypothetical protein